MIFKCWYSYSKLKNDFLEYKEENPECSILTISSRSLGYSDVEVTDEEDEDDLDASKLLDNYINEDVEESNQF